MKNQTFFSISFAIALFIIPELNLNAGDLSMRSINDFCSLYSTFACENTGCKTTLTSSTAVNEVRTSGTRLIEQSKELSAMVQEAKIEKSRLDEVVSELQKLEAELKAINESTTGQAMWHAVKVFAGEANSRRDLVFAIARLENTKKLLISRLREIDFFDGQALDFTGEGKNAMTALRDTIDKHFDNVLSLIKGPMHIARWQHSPVEAVEHYIALKDLQKKYEYSATDMWGVTRVMADHLNSGKVYDTPLTMDYTATIITAARPEINGDVNIAVTPIYSGFTSKSEGRKRTEITTYEIEFKSDLKDQALSIFDHFVRNLKPLKEKGSYLRSDYILQGIGAYSRLEYRFGELVFDGESNSWKMKVQTKSEWEYDFKLRSRFFNEERDVFELQSHNRDFLYRLMKGVGKFGSQNSNPTKAVSIKRPFY